MAEFAVAVYSCLLPRHSRHIPVDCIYPQERLREICHLASALTTMTWRPGSSSPPGTEARYWRAGSGLHHVSLQAAQVNPKGVQDWA